MTDMLQQADALRQEADHLLYTGGLLALIEAVGPTVIQGSYDYGLMTWRDIDITVQLADAHDVPLMFALGQQVALRFSVGKMVFSNMYVREDTPFEYGLYWGVHMPYQGAQWKIDIWGYGAPQYAQQVAAFKKLRVGLQQAGRATVLQIKRDLMQRGDYRQTVFSMDLYAAVIDGGVRSLAAFDAWWEQRSCAS